MAKRAVEDGFYDTSLGLLERFLKQYPTSPKIPEANLLISRCYFYQNRLPDALVKLQELINNPSATSIKDAVLYWIAELHFRSNRFTQAATYYKMIIDEFPKSSYSSAAYYSLGWCLFQERRFNDALQYFKAVEERFPREPQVQDASFKIIECMFNLKEYVGLREKLRFYLKIYSKDVARLSYLYFYMAEADYYMNNFQEALDEYSIALLNTTDSKMQALSKLGIGWVYLKLKRCDEALKMFLEIKSDEPVVLAQVYLGKAEALYDRGEYKEAIRSYQEAQGKTNTESMPQEITDKLHYGLGWVYLKEGEYKKAIDEFQKIVKDTEDKIIKVAALCQIGDAYQDSGDYNKAVQVYDSILKDYPDSSYGDYVRYQLGLSLLKSSNYDGAALALRALIADFPDSKLLDEAYYELGLAYFKKEDYRASKETLDKFQEEFKDSALMPQAIYLLGTSLYNLGNFTQAIEVFKNIIRTYNQDTELMQKAEYEIADCYYKMGNEREALSRFKTLRTKYPDSSLTPEIMWWLGEYYYRRNELSLARRYFSSLIQDFPKSDLVASAYYALGSTYKEESKYQEAVDNFRKVIELNKSDLSLTATIAIADMYAEQEKFDLALEIYHDLAQEHSNLANSVYPRIAGLYFKINNYDEAINFYRKSLGMVSPKEASRIQFKIAEVLQAQGKITEAIGEYLKVTHLDSDSNDVAVKSLLRAAAIYEDKENFKEAANIYKRITSMNIEEAKYAKERIDWIKTHIK